MTQSDDMPRNYQAFFKCLRHDYPYEWNEAWEGNEVRALFDDVLQNLHQQHARINNAYFSRDGQGIVDLKYMDHFLALCYRFGNRLYKNGIQPDLADVVYYSCRLRTATDVFYKCEIGDYFIPAHPIGAAIDSHAKYGIGFRLYNGVHIGPYNIIGKEPKDWVHPTFGDGVILFANSSVYGDTKIGNNVTVTPGTMVVNETVPDNSILFGISPNLRALPNSFNNLSILNL